MKYTSSIICFNWHERRYAVDHESIPAQTLAVIVLCLVINLIYMHCGLSANIGADPEIFHRGWLSGWLHVLYYTELWGVAGKH